MKSLQLPFGNLDRSIVSMARDANSDIQPGQCFKQNGIAWEVVKFTSVHGIPHVQIMKADDPTEHKLISVRTLRGDYDLAPV